METLLIVVVVGWVSDDVVIEESEEEASVSFVPFVDALEVVGSVAKRVERHDSG